MGNFGKVPYEISLWEDTHLDDSGNTLSYFREKKLAIIASDTMNTPTMAYDKNLTENVNGSYKLTFKMYYKYNDGEGLVDNPFIQFMVNERKVKLLYKDEWYEFLIKDIKENSSDYTFSYTLEGAHIIELSKNGFNLEFDQKLNNNQGTATELGQGVLKDTNWQLIDNTGFNGTSIVNVNDDHGNRIISDCIIQETKEALFEYVSSGVNITVQSITVTDQGGTQLSEPFSLPITANKKIYVFYSVAMASENGDIQFIYRDDGQYTTDSERNITNGGYFLIRNSAISRSAGTYGYNIDLSGTRLFTAGNVSEDYRGIRYVISKMSKYDPLVDKYVDIYKDTNDNKLVNVYTEIATDARENILNIVSNYKGFNSISGWKGISFNNDNSDIAEIAVVSMPDIITIFANSVGSSTAIQNVDKYTSLVRFTCENNKSVGFNSGPNDNKVQIKSYSEGQNFHCILRAKILSSELPAGDTTLGTLSSYPGSIIVATYTTNADGAYVVNEEEGGDVIVNFNTFSAIQEGQYLHGVAKCLRTINEADVKDKRFGIFFKTNANSRRYIYIEECWIYKEVVDAQGDAIIATAPPDYEVTINTRYRGYKPADNNDVTDKEDISYCCEANSESEFLDSYSNYELQTNDNSVKILSITAKESNYFNLIQTICETFECWAKFTILHNNDGSVKFENGRPCKYVTLHKYVGQPNYAGFRYGVNLNGITRSLVSTKIVTKLIVKNNKNKYAPNGFCAVGLAHSNPTRQNYLFNFDNYINTGLLDRAQLENDLWNEETGYYKVVSNASKQYDELTDKIEEINSILYPLKTQITEAEVGMEAASKEIDDAEATCFKKYKCQYTDFLKGMNPLYDPTYVPGPGEPARLPLQDSGHLMAWCVFNRENRTNVSIGEGTYDGYFNSETAEKECKADIAAITELKNKYNKYAEVLRETSEPGQEPSIKMQYDNYMEEIKEYEEERAQYVTIIENANKAFYNKYYRFIQEGTWVDESYVDNEKYYLDAVSILYNSSQPEISYDIKVIDLSALDEYKGYECHLGDKTYIEDTEFFGYVLKDGVETPYQEEIVVTELVSVLDNPSKNTIKVQTKKTQFQDLFHRLTATVQSVKFSTGAYDRAAGIVQEDLTIDTDFLQASFDKNALTIHNAANQTVVIDENGITTTSKDSPNNIVRIINGGIFMSNDGGETWELGISAEDGINTHLLRAGQIDTALIQIYDGMSPSFRWDSNGISAFVTNKYHNELPEGPDVIGYDYQKAVRFNQYGIYGFEDPTGTFNPNSSNNPVSYIMDSEAVKFGLTWKGFVFRHTGTENNNTIRIGSLDNSGNKYGIQIYHNNEVVFDADDHGSLTLSGIIYAAGGKLADWIIGEGGITYSVSGSSVRLIPPNGSDLTDNVLEFSYNNNVKFAVDGQGNVTAGNLNCTGGTIGGCTIDNQGNLIIKNANVDSINGIDIGKIKATVDSPPVTWPSEITATKITISGNGTSKIANWKVKGNKLYNGIDTLNPSSGSGVCLDAGDSDDPSGVTIYENSSNYFKFDTSNGLEIKSGGVNDELYINNGLIWVKRLEIDAGGTIQVGTMGQAVDAMKFYGVDISLGHLGNIAIYANGIVPAASFSQSIGSSTAHWTDGYIDNIVCNTITANNTITVQKVNPSVNDTWSIGDSLNYWRDGYFTDIHITNSNNLSDFRLKRNINSISNRYLSLFDDLDVVSYEFTREVTARTHIGVIAQDVDAALAKNGICNFAGVTHDEAVDKYYVSYNDISMLHMAHYKNFLKTNDARIALLESKISELEKEIQNLRNH